MPRSALGGFPLGDFRLGWDLFVKKTGGIKSLDIYSLLNSSEALIYSSYTILPVIRSAVKVGKCDNQNLVLSDLVNDPIGKPTHLASPSSGDS